MKNEGAQIVTLSPAGPPPTADLTPMSMIDRAVASGASIETLERLMSLQERWEKNQARRAFDEAMAAAKAEIPVILKNRTVDFTGKTGIRTNYRHEDLGEIARTVDPVLARYGLSYRFRTTSVLNEPVTVTCIVSHRGGHSEENTLTGPRDDSGNKNAIQAVGSAITFLQRYTLKAALGLAASVDDDGRSAGEAETITNEQADELRLLADEVKADLPKFCTYLKVPSLHALPAKDFDRAKAALEAKRGK